MTQLSDDDATEGSNKSKSTRTGSRRGTHQYNLYECVAVVRTHPDDEEVEFPPVAPEEVLFRRSGAPERYEENDFYWADRDLPSDVVLPDSDLLKAIHTYASDFYGRSFGEKSNPSFLSMDETALMAIGVLLEEAAAEVLGETGHTALMEWRAKSESPMVEATGEESNAASSESDSKPQRKRVKLDQSATSPPKTPKNAFTGSRRSERPQYNFLTRPSKPSEELAVSDLEQKPR